jgi:hypothetical protein
MEEGKGGMMNLIHHKIFLTHPPGTVKLQFEDG